MKRLSLLVILGLLTACQTSLPPTPQSLNAQSAPRANTVNTVANTAASNSLTLSATLLRELDGFDEEGDPSLDAENARLDESLIAQTIGTKYVQAHSYYYQTADQGKSSIEAILAHDGHTEAARLVRHWSKLLGENATWPDQQSTTYQGRWPALEHAELKRGGGWFMFRSASTKADEYYAKAKSAWRKGLAPDHPEQAEAWAWLGRTSHFLQDLTVPFHTVSLLRPSQLRHHTQYEVSCDELFERYLPSRNYNPQGVWVHGPYPAQGSWGVYYAPGTTAAAMIRQNADYARKFYKFVNESESWTQQNWERTRAVMVPLGAKTSAGLIKSFLNEVGVSR